MVVMGARLKIPGLSFRTGGCRMLSGNSRQDFQRCLYKRIMPLRCLFKGHSSREFQDKLLPVTLLFTAGQLQGFMHRAETSLTIATTVIKCSEYGCPYSRNQSMTQGCSRKCVPWALKFIHPGLECKGNCLKTAKPAGQKYYF